MQTRVYSTARVLARSVVDKHGRSLMQADRRTEAHHGVIAYFQRPARRFEALALAAANTIIVFTFGIVIGKDALYMAFLAIGIGLLTWRIGRMVS